jgi:hypothetical protein
MGYDVVIGLDVGKSVHHAVALDPEGRRLVDREVANAEAALRELFGRAAGEGELLVVVDQLHSIGALPVTVARAMGIDVAYLRVCRCGGWRTCIRGARRLTRGMRSSSRTRR